MNKQDTQKAAETFIDSGYEYSGKGDHDMAIKNYNKAIKLDSNNFEAYYLRGIAYYDKGNYNQAIKDYNEAINVAKNVAKKATEDKAKKINTELAMVYGNRGMAYKNKGDDKKAIEDYNKAIEIAPNNPNNVITYVNRGNLYAISEGTLDMAIKDYYTALSLDQNNANAKKYLELVQDIEKNFGGKCNLRSALEENEKGKRKKL